MIFVTGPLFAGKREYICKALGWSEEDLARRGIWEVQNLAGQEEDLEKLAKNLAQYEVVIATEVGGGVVPVDPVQRQNREAAGRLAWGWAGSSQPWRLSSSQGEPLTRCRERPGSSRTRALSRRQETWATVYRPGVSFRARRTSFRSGSPEEAPASAARGRAET